jgi:hypothetical protein
MGGVAALGSGIQGLFQIMGVGTANTTALEAAALSQQFQQEEQDMILQMGLAELENEQMQASLIGKGITTIYSRQQQTTEDFFKTTQKVADNWIQALGGSGRG